MQSSSHVSTEQILFTRGVPAPEALPTTLISECLQAVLEGPEGKSVLQYGHNGGYLSLRRMLSEQYNVSLDQVLVGNGSLHLQDLLSAVLVKPGDVVLVDQSCFARGLSDWPARIRQAAHHAYRGYHSRTRASHAGRRRRVLQTRLFRIQPGASEAALCPSHVHNDWRSKETPTKHTLPRT